MKISVVGFKGGVAKTTTAIHLAAYLQRLAPNLLADGYQNRSALEWAGRGDGAPFAVAATSARSSRAVNNFTETGVSPVLSVSHLGFFKLKNGRRTEQKGKENPPGRADHRARRRLGRGSDHSEILNAAAIVARLTVAGSKPIESSTTRLEQV